MAPRPQPLFPLPDAEESTGALLGAAQQTIEALESQGAIEDWHRLDCVIVLELAKAVGESRGIAKSQMFGQLLMARARLPEPVVATIEAEALEYEGARAIEYFQRHSADLEDSPQPAPLD